VAKVKKQYLDFEIDKITNSIEDALSGMSLPTEVRILIKDDLTRIKKGQAWSFNWKQEFQSADRDVFKLVATIDPGTVQGFISITSSLIIFT